MEKKLLRRLNILTAYAVVSTLFLGWALFSSFEKKGKQENVDELTVKRINLVGEDGSLRMVISNETRQDPGRVSGRALPKRVRPAGIIFFNNKGDECGGIIADVSEKDSVSSEMSFTMDNYHNDQVVQILNSENYHDKKGKVQRGLIINEFPVGADMISTLDAMNAINRIKDEQERNKKLKDLWDTEGPKRRLFVGRDVNNNSGLFLYDRDGRPRLKLFVDSTGNARLEVVDSNGNSKNIITGN